MPGLTIWVRTGLPGDDLISLVARFTPGTSGKIGRGPSCALRLPDTRRHVSREHAEVHFFGDGWALRALSANPMRVDSTELHAGDSVSLRGGETIAIGDYVLSTAIEELPAPSDDLETILHRPPPPVPWQVPVPTVQPAVPTSNVPLAPPTTPVAGTSDDLRRGMRAFGEGLGIDPALLDGIDPAWTLRLAGDLLKTSLNGIVRMLEVRRQFKSELPSVDQTAVTMNMNNPLKHLPDDVTPAAYFFDLKQHVMRQRAGGLMPPLMAIDDAVWDLSAHELALLAATRAAMLTAVRTFHPEAIEQRVQKKGARFKLPNTDKASLWDAFLSMYAKMEKEAGETFDKELHREFAKAYQQQTVELQKKKAALRDGKATLLQRKKS